MGEQNHKTCGQCACVEGCFQRKRMAPGCVARGTPAECGWHSVAVRARAGAQHVLSGSCAPPPRRTSCFALGWGLRKERVVFMWGAYLQRNLMIPVLRQIFSAPATCVSPLEQSTLSLSPAFLRPDPENKNRPRCLRMPIYLISLETCRDLNHRIDKNKEQLVE